MSTTQAEKKARLARIFNTWAGEEAQNISPLPRSGSNREYYRIRGKTARAVGVYNEDYKENMAFIHFSRHFKSYDLPVPEIYAEAIDQHVYLQEDLGDITLFGFIVEEREKPDYYHTLVTTYKKVIEQLPYFQIKAAKDFDYSYCYPRHSFDKQSMLWDLNYFKYYFLRLAHVGFDEQALEDDFKRFTDFLMQAGYDFFLYRDFQSRNVMLKDGTPYFIDYQGGRKGALQYDIASLLYDAKADLPQHLRDELLDYYIAQVRKFIAIDEEAFREYYTGYVLIRIMQALGAYGFRGFYERKEHFLQSIPFALDNLGFVLNNTRLPVQIPELEKSLRGLVKRDDLRKMGQTAGHLHVTVTSFSFRKGYPQDISGHGGGHVFDCRVVYNPGREAQYVDLTGKDALMREFLDKNQEMQQFLIHARAIVKQSVDKYQKRNFSNLSVSFGCTGGRHRSVYAAEAMAAYLKENFHVQVHLQHRDLPEG